MRILITGSTGFVGKSLIKMLEEAGHEIFHLVRNKKRFEHEFIWNFKDSLPKELPACNIVVHLSAYVDFGLYLYIEQYDVNTVSTIKLSDYAKTHNAYFIFASMVGIHGSKYTRIDKNTPIAPENHYAMSKYIAEEVVKTFTNNYSILRICGIYGVDGPQHLGLNKAISDAIFQKKPPVVKGHGKAKRNYICVLDVARWIFSIVQKYEMSREEKIQETLYLAGPEIMTIEEYLQTIVNTVLPGMELTRIKGDESSDLIVDASPYPSDLRTFREYLISLI